MAHRQIKRERKAPAQPAPGAVEYVGKRTKTGNSMGFRFEIALFRSHPEFSGTVRAQVIAPGQLLVTADSVERDSAEENDPVLGPFLALLARDMAKNPHTIQPLDQVLMKEIAALTARIEVNFEEDLGDENLL